ncbi:MAG: hypothetical protein AAF705_00045 [Bacteroidota bacterium]
MKDVFNSVKEKLDNYHSPIDLDQEWSAINAAQRKRVDKKRNRRIRFYSLAMALTLGLLLGLWFNKTTEGKKKNIDIVIAEKASSRQSEEIDSSNQQIEECDLISQQDISLVKENDQIALIVKEISAPNTTEIEFNPRHQDIHSKEKEHVLKEKKQLEIKTADKIASGQNLIAPIPRTVFSLALNLREVPERFASEDWIMTNELLGGQLIDPTNKDRMEEDIVANHKVATQFFFRAGLGYSGQRLRAKEEAFAAFQDLRATTEEALETYRFEAGIKKQIAAKSSIQLSVNYQHSYDRIQHQYEAPKDYFFEDVLLARITDVGTGEVTERFGDTTIVGTSTLINTQYNQYKSLSASVAWGHALLQKQNLRIDFTGGLYYNFWLQTEGLVVDKVNLDGPLRPLDDYRKASQFGLSTGLDLDFRLGNDIWINARPVGTYGLFSATSGEALRSNFYSLSFMVGLKFTL